MSQSWSDVTGELLYSGTPNVTPVVEALLGPFRLGEADEVLTEIQRVAESCTPSWDDILDGLAEVVGVDIENGMDSEALVAGVREKFGDGAAEAVERTLESGAASGAEPDVGEVVSLAMLMNDGHNLVGVTAQGAWGGDRIQVGTFGGWSEYTTARVAMVHNTERLCEMGRSIDEAIESGCGAEKVGLAMQSLSHVTGGCVVDPVARKAFRLALAAWLVKTAEEEWAEQAQ